MSKVQKIFNSPWGVAALSVAALVIVYHNVIQPMLNDSDDEIDYVENDTDDSSNTNALMMLDDDMSDVDADDQSRVNNRMNSVTKKIDLDQLVWLKHPVRDPFKPVKKVKRNVQGQRSAPVLSAIFAGGPVALAVLDGEIVETGNKVGAYVVTQIAQQSVALSGPYGKTRLTMSRSK